MFKVLLFTTLIVTAHWVNAQVTVTPATTISDLCLGGSSQVLSNITIAETANNDFNDAGGTFILQTPANFEWANVGTVIVSGTQLGFVSAMITSPSTLELTFNNTPGGSAESFTLSGFEVRAVTATASGNIVRSGGTMTANGNDPPDAVNHGSLASIGPPAITVQPSNSTICEAGNTSFSVSASGSGLTYQWQVSTDNGASYANLVNGGIYSNVTAASMDITSAGLSENGNFYRVIVSGTCPPAVTSNVAVLSVQGIPSISSSPANATICEGNTTSFNVSATGTGLTYQWQENSSGSFVNVTNGGVYSGATTPILTLTGVPSSFDTYTYRAVVSGTCTPSVTSTAGTLTVNTLPVVTLDP
ncbi:MAG: hypothetical protein MJA30_05810, partial [Cytophagales bacterium]|nr:hypothetical protein [Cytophagales bacterium]